jgi:hypothetical protein
LQVLQNGGVAQEGEKLRRLFAEVGKRGKREKGIKGEINETFPFHKRP